LIFSAQAVPTPVFRFSVVLFALFTLPVSSLRFPLVSELAGKTTFIATICLPSPAAPANVKIKTAPSTLNHP
jgi:hypothetical protein